MVHLTVAQITEILIFIGCGNKIRTQQEVCNLFNAKYPDNPITQSTVSKIEYKFRETGDVKDLPKSRRPKITQDKKIDIVLSMEENSQSTSTLVASENYVSQTTVLRILRKENYHPDKFQLVQELNEDDPDRRLQFCETMMNLRAKCIPYCNLRFTSLGEGHLVRQQARVRSPRLLPLSPCFYSSPQVPLPTPHQDRPNLSLNSSEFAPYSRREFHL
ncbi:hypothetical protein NQ318_000250 [Aromia moschata]|uniref:DUF4817 domain-containing protein n=1 Tax=Aromia moschata TaxID=1265417 RepID=A0AAV8YUP2_9CUCU|nr:hypothetical protein NQ318_000250 [Aromia moschata]